MDSTRREHDKDVYAPPQVTVLGTLAELTLGQGFSGDDFAAEASVF